MTNNIAHTAELLVVSDIMLFNLNHFCAFSFWWGTGFTLYTVLLQSVLLCFIYFSKV